MDIYNEQIIAIKLGKKGNRKERRGSDAQTQIITLVCDRLRLLLWLVVMPVHASPPTLHCHHPHSADLPLSPLLPHDPQSPLHPHRHPQTQCSSLTRSHHHTNPAMAAIWTSGTTPAISQSQTSAPPCPQTRTFPGLRRADTPDYLFPATSFGKCR
jgi:hypothetical protein